MILFWRRVKRASRSSVLAPPERPRALLNRTSSPDRAATKAGSVPKINPASTEITAVNAANRQSRSMAAAKSVAFAIYPDNQQVWTI